MTEAEFALAAVPWTASAVGQRVAAFTARRFAK